MIRLLYNLFLPIGLLVFLPAYLLKMRRRGNYRRNLGQRFGLYDRKVRERLHGSPRTWIHAVSVGEVAIALKLAQKLRELDSAFRCVLTTTTTTGRAFAEREAPEWMEVLYNPLDLWPVVRRAFSVIHPQRLILVEAEVWPNLAAEARARRIPLSLVNARLSPRSERRFRRFRALVRPTFRCLDLVCVQEEEDVERWAGVGVPRKVIRQVGSIKYDPTDNPVDPALMVAALDSLGLERGRPILLAGSTHAGEEEILGEIFQRLRGEFPKLFLMIAPRHVERTTPVRTALQTLGLNVSLRTEIGQARRVVPDCLLLNTTGELRAWYTVATVVFVGKSLTAHGGQNPVEPILAGRPVVFGPHMENFAALAKSLYDQHGAVQVSDRASLAEAIARLLRDPAERERLVKNAHHVLAAHRGATERTAELVLACKSLAPT